MAVYAETVNLTRGCVFVKFLVDKLNCEAISRVFHVTRDSVWLREEYRSTVVTPSKNGEFELDSSLVGCTFIVEGYTHSQLRSGSKTTSFPNAGSLAVCSPSTSYAKPRKGADKRATTAVTKASTYTTAVGLSVAGVWYNELGSKMVVSEKSDAKGQFTGTFHTRVGDQYSVVGCYDTGGNTTHGTLGFTVQWHNEFKNSYSVTTWSGQRQLDATGAPCLLTTWLLTSETKGANDCVSTKVGTNVFTRNKVALPAAPKHLYCSHPEDAHR